ncbi:hemerythrin domain-containing protein [Variovorax sp. J22P240]|uniref:hemerythrin domain-containing protein n=1 Tax=Variovorax sp. J22P240 TaxID=3053514 RepID=UPI002575BC11|nr:hemerythrin domain-containing protein [Variovorax sp. J22P240]MDM0000721.1 hemerythrin domain-containing protein [Variovorax sp. J22P240]
MTSQIAQWHAEHGNFSLLLSFLDEQVARFRDGENPDYHLMLEIVSYLREFGDCFHHPREDAAFTILATHDPRMQLPINRLHQDHRVLAVAGEELVARLNQVISETYVRSATVEAAAALYLAYYRHHLAAEERQILPHARLLLTAQDWEVVARAAPSCPDPLFGDTPTRTYLRLAGMIAARSSGERKQDSAAGG